MNRLFRTLLITTLLSVTGVAFFFQSLKSMTGFWSIVTSQSSAKDTKCGIHSLFIAARLMGIPVEFEDLSSIPVDPQLGSSLGDLKQGATRIGLRAHTQMTDWETIRQHEGAAILLIDGNHFVVAKPDTSSTGNEITIHDPNSVVGRWTKEKLLARWSGQCLLLSKSPASVDILWETCWMDAGIFDDAETAKFDIAYTNASDKEQSFEVVRSSCSCTSAKLSKRQLGPGESGVLTVLVNLIGKIGRFNETVVVGCSNSIQPTQKLVVCGSNANLRELLSVRESHFGGVFAGSSTSQEIVFRNPLVGDPLSIESVRLVEETTSAEGGPKPICHTSFRRYDGKISTPQADRLRLKEGDFIITVKMDVPELTPPCNWEGVIQINSNLPGNSTAYVNLACTIQPDLAAEPSAVLLSGADINEEKKVKVVSRSGRELRLNKIDNLSDLPIEIRIQDGSNAFFVRRKASGDAGGKRIVEGALNVFLSDGSSVAVPILIMGSDSGQRKPNPNPIAE